MNAIEPKSDDIRDGFGLTDFPFRAGTVSTQAVKTATAKIVELLRGNERMVVVRSSPGVGLTTVLHNVASRMRESGHAVHEAAPARLDRVPETGILIVDEADRLPPGKRRKMFDPRAGRRTILGITGELPHDLQAASHPVVELPRLSPIDAALYLDASLQAVGASREIFERDAFAMLMTRADGSLRNLRRIAGAAMIEAAAAGRGTVSRQDVRAAADPADLSPPAARSAPAPSPALGEKPEADVIPLTGAKPLIASASATATPPASASAPERPAPTPMVDHTQDEMDEPRSSRRAWSHPLVNVGSFALGGLATVLLAPLLFPGPASQSQEEIAPRVEERATAASTPEPEIVPLPRVEESPAALPGEATAAGKESEMADADIRAPESPTPRAVSPEARETVASPRRAATDPARTSRNTQVATATPSRTGGPAETSQSVDVSNQEISRSAGPATAQVRPRVQVVYLRGSKPSERRARQVVESMEGAGWDVSALVPQEAPITRLRAVAGNVQARDDATRLATWLGATMPGDLGKVPPSVDVASAERSGGTITLMIP